MSSFLLVFRSLFKRKNRNIVKIISLGSGLAVGLVLIAKVYFNASYENFYPDRENIYQVFENYRAELGLGKNDESDGPISGGVVRGMADEIPQVMAATRYCSLYRGIVNIGYDRFVDADVILADSCLYDVIPRPMIYGNAKQILSAYMQAMVSRSFAEKMGGDVIGRTIELNISPGNIITISGIFEDVPENSMYRYDIALSLPSIGKFIWDGSMEWDGNDKYVGLVKLIPGVTPESLSDAVADMQARHVDMEEMKKEGTDKYYSLIPISEIYSNDSSVKKQSVTMLALALSMMFVGLFNYILIVISTVVERSKEIAVNKCYGAEDRNIRCMMFTETFIHFLLSLIFAIGLIMIFKNSVEELLGHSLRSLFSYGGCLLLVSIFIVILFVTTYVLSEIFVKIPVASALGKYKKSKYRWKTVLLFLQFAGTTAFFIFLVILWRQYQLMLNDDVGYTYENVAYVYMDGVAPEVRQTVVDVLKREAFVEAVSTGNSLLVYGEMAGNDVYMPDGETVAFNACDLHCADENYLSLFDIPIIEGNGFNKESIVYEDMLVSREFAKRLTELTGWNDGVIDKTVYVTQWNTVTIRGVYEDVKIGSATHPNQRPTMVFYGHNNRIMFVKMHELNYDNILKVQNLIKSVVPDTYINVVPYKNEMAYIYHEDLMYRNAIMICAIIMLMITVMGLVGYVNNEVNRRSAEIILRRINGATVNEVLKIFVVNICRLALPAMIIGGTVAYFMGEKWMRPFAVKTSLSPMLFIVCGSVILAIISMVVVLSAWRVATRRPAEVLRKE